MLTARQEKITAFLREKQSVSVNELIDLLQVSPATVRRELERLEQKNLLRRTFGGAMDIQTVGYEPSYSKRLEESTVEKRAIARALFSLIKPGEILALDSGTTVTEAARLMANIQPLTIVTPSMTIAQIVAEAEQENTNVILTGGILRGKTMSLVGDVCEEVILKYRCDKTIVGCTAISPEHGAMNANLLALGVKKSLVSISKQLIIVADHTKFERTALAIFASINQIDTIVTDWLTPPDILEKFSKKGINVVIAQP